VTRPCTVWTVTTRVRGRGTVRRLLFGAALAAFAAAGAFAAPVAATDRLPDMQAERPTEVHFDSTLRFPSLPHSPSARY
jgi:hypothetical protein